MKVIISTASNADLAEQAVIALGWEPLFLCQQAPRSAKTATPIRYFAEPAEYESEIVKVLRQCPGEVLYFSTAASDKMQAIDAGYRQLVEKNGGRYIGQPSSAIERSASKTTSRHLASEQGMLIVPSVASKSDVESGKNYVVKRVFGDSGDGQKILPSSRLLDEFDELGSLSGYLVEEFIDGIEISANVYRSDYTFYMGPLIVKGETGLNNLHSVDKVRAIYPGRFEHLENLLVPACRQFANALNATGWLDIEFVVAKRGIYFLEVNARFNGLSRLAYLSSGLNPYCISLTGAFPSECRKPHYAIEIPLRDAVRSNDDIPGVFHTSYVNPKLTVGKYSLADADLQSLYGLVFKLGDGAIFGGFPAIAEETAVKLEGFSSKF